MRLIGCVAFAACIATAANADPNLPYDDLRWIALRDAMAQGRIPDRFGGVQWADDDVVGHGFWALPLHRATLRVDAASEHDRTYSLPLRHRDLVGSIALSCEYNEGRPCGDGARAGVELDSAVGWGTLLAAATRVRVGAGSHYGDAVALDRAYLKFEYGLFRAQVGRDVLVLGPSARGALMVSDNAVPQDGLRLQLRPFALPFAPDVRLGFFYFIDRLRQPQRFTGTIADCARMEIDIADRVQLGGSRLLQLGGQGAPDYGGLEGFILEHFGRTRETAGGSAENNRLSFDGSVRIPSWGGARVYYEIAFEDTRSRFLNSLRYDADHLVGLEVRALRVGPWRRFFFELEHTGWVSQEHSIWTTGMSNGGRPLGTPLGPDATSVWLRADFDVAGAVVAPWVEWLRFTSNQYGSDQEHGVFVTALGPIEHRQRIGATLDAPLAPSWSLSGGVFAERVANADLVEGATRAKVGFRASLTYAP